MDVLKKVKSATLVEALIATILIVVIFIIASLVINNLLLNNFSHNTQHVESRLNELEYNLINKKITFPYLEEFEKWDINISKINDKVTGKTWFEIKAYNGKVEIIRRRSYASY